VTIHGERPPSTDGGVFLVDVLLRKATLFEEMFPSIHDGAAVVPSSAVEPPGGERQRQAEDQRTMAHSQDIAAVVALRELGFDVGVVEAGALVIGVRSQSPAVGKLEVGQIITAVDGVAVRSTDDLRRLIGRRKPGDRVRLEVRNGSERRTVVLGTIPSPDDPSQPIVGIGASAAVTVKLPFPVRIDAGDIVGPSAGLAFALDIVDELGRDVDRGYRVAATGELSLDGLVHPVGAIKQKVIGALRTKMDVFVVPAGDNAREARRYAGMMRIVPVHSFRQALRHLATLPRKP
jgi:PDZ domain-containing protein